MAQTMTLADHDRVTEAVGEAERLTDGEIVTIVAAQSDDYRETPYKWAFAALFLYLSSLAIFPSFHLAVLEMLTGGWQHVYSPAEYMTMILVVAAIKFIMVFWLVRWRPLRIALTPKSIREARVRARAVTMFKVGAERRTMGLTGILIYLSMAEHRAEIVSDEAIAAKVDPDIWGDAMAAMIAELKQGRPGAGMAAAVEKVGIVLAEHFPKSQGNPNELPDRLIEL